MNYNSKSLDVFRENIRWLRSDRDSHGNILQGVGRELAEYILKSSVSSLPEPSEVLEMLVLTAGEEEALWLFPTIASSLCELNHGRELSASFSPTDVAYIKSPGTDTAFEAFSKTFRGMKPIFASSFKEMCEDLFYDRTDACILPLESSEEGLFMSFRQMMLKYELSIISVCKLRSEESFTSFALITSDKKVCGEYSEYFFSSLTPSEYSLLLHTVSVLEGEFTRLNSFEMSPAGEMTVHMTARFKPESRTAARYCMEALFPAGLHLGDYDTVYAELT